MWGNEKAQSRGLIPGRQTWGPLVLILACPPFATLFFYMVTVLEGDPFRLFEFLVAGDGPIYENIVRNTYSIWPEITLLEVQIVFSFMAFQLLLMKIVPGSRFEGPVTPGGNIPVYKANGVQCHVITLAAFVYVSDGLTLIAQYFGDPRIPRGLDLFRAALVYDRMGHLVSFLNAFALSFCLFLYFKGIFFPSSSDHGTSGNPPFDYYWGTELYPRIFGWDLKQFTNCRWGLMTWTPVLLSYMAAQYERLGFVTDAMFVSVAIQAVYCTKFFVWETGYLCSMDIHHDRAGFYICWGCLVWVPSMYTYCTIFLVDMPYFLGPPLAGFILTAGIVSVLVNYDADRQRQAFRKAKGKDKIWGKNPDFITANYKTAEGENRQSLLLCSGWWGISRHFHYIAELAGAFFWCCPAVFGPSPRPLSLFYFFFLIILLTDRAYRDDARCASKYGKHWKKYCERVPYKLLPGII